MQSTLQTCVTSTFHFQLPYQPNINMNFFDEFDSTEDVNMVSTTTNNAVPPMGTSDYEKNKNNCANFNVDGRPL